MGGGRAAPGAKWASPALAQGPLTFAIFAEALQNLESLGSYIGIISFSCALTRTIFVGGIKLSITQSRFCMVLLYVCLRSS